MNNADLFGHVPPPNPGGGKLAEAFVLPPFSVLNARDGWWQERKRAWLALGIQSEMGRGTPLDTNGSPACDDYRRRQGNYARTFGQDLMRGEHVVGEAPRMQIPDASAEHQITGTSIFDPVLCELVYRWFCPPGGVVLDPFAGGSVRGIVASVLGYQYIGIDLRREQVAANERQASAICNGIHPSWITGDGRDVGEFIGGNEADLVFTCPPYGNLEVYSDDPRDISTMDYPSFLKAYAAIIQAAAACLAQNRFACIVIGDFRDKRGHYHGLPWHTIEIAAACGLAHYNDAILVTAVGSLPVRTGKQFTASRKLGKTHQNVLVFVKGCPRKATKEIAGT